MKKTNKKFWLAALLTAAVLTGVSGCGEITTPSSSLTERSTETTAEQTQAETTAAPEETAETTDTKTTAAETLPAQESSETTAAETTAVSQSAGDTSAYEETAERLFGALDYIDQIGAGNLPKDESDTIRSTGSGAVYEKVAKTQFSSTADLKAYMESSLTQKMIDSRYAAILGTDQPLYIDANGSLYGRQFATSGGFSWTSGKAEVSDLSDSAFTASMQYDDFGASATLTAQIVLENGQWKIVSIQQTN